MPAVLHQSQGAGISVAASTTRYFMLGCNARFNDDMATETHAQTTWRTGGTFRNLYINILTNDRATTTWRTRVNAGNGGMSVSIDGTGEFEDVTNSDTVTAGEEWNYSLVTGAGGTVFTFRIASVVFTATNSSETVARMLSGGGPDIVNDASVTYFFPLLGGDGFSEDATEANKSLITETAATMDNFLINITANTRTPTTFGTRIDGANGNLTLSVADSATGLFEDTSNSDVVAVDDVINGYMTTGTGTNSITIGQAAVDFTTTNNKTMYTAAAQGGSAQLEPVTTYWPFAGALRTSVTESDMQSDAKINFVGSLLAIKITANTLDNNATLTFRKNTAAAKQVVTITALTTGTFQDTVNIDLVTKTDVLSYETVTTASAGSDSMTIRSIAMLGDMSTPTATTTQPFVSIITGTITASKGVTKTATLTQAFIIIATGTTAGEIPVSIDDKTATVTQAFISVLTNTTTANKVNPRTTSTTQAFISIAAGVITASRSDLKTATITQAFVRIITNTTTGVIPTGVDDKYATVTQAVISILTNTTSGTQPSRTAQLTTVNVSIITNTATAGKIVDKVATVTQSIISIIANATSGSIPSASTTITYILLRESKFDKQPVYKSRVEKFIDSESRFSNKEVLVSKLEP